MRLLYFHDNLSTISLFFVNLPVRVDEVNDADGGADEEAERPGNEHAPEAPAHLKFEHDILKDEE